ncbi:MAG: glycosyltransferase family 4 protein [Gelidibacter sp.]|nr:glycosyltransferase family 4 protein [Gelidibacter sp.]
MHIAFLTPEYPHQKINHSAGIGSSIKNLAVALSKKGHDITVIVYAQKKSEIFEEEGVNIHLLENKKYNFGKWYFYRKYIQNYCEKLIKTKKIDLIEAPDWTGITAFMKFKIPLVIRFHGSDTYFCYLEKRKQKLKNFWFEKLAVKKAAAFIAPTSFAGEVSQKLFGIKDRTIKTIHYGLDLQKFENLNPEVYENGLILYIGTIIRKKGVLELPAIFSLVEKQYPRAKLILIGGDSFDIISQSKSTWGLIQQELAVNIREKVIYLGKIPYQEVQAYMKKAHVCVFPTFAETLGMVTIESMALLKPVVNSNIGWAQELIVDGESGFLVHPENHQQYAEKIISIIENKQLAVQMGQNARRRVESVFNIEKIADKNIEFYKSLID